MTTQHCKEIMKYMAQSGVDVTQMTWFDISGLQIPLNIENAMNDLSIYRPPFETCLLLWKGPSNNHQSYEISILVKGNDPELGIAISCSKGPSGALPRQLPILAYALSNDKLYYGPVEESESITEEESSLILGFIVMWYRAMASGYNGYKPEILNTFTNKRKISQGKLPKYDWRTVKIVLGKQKSSGASNGGSHASPRAHDRRGHIRRLQNGKNVWVKPCRVGDASLGTVFHDYLIIQESEIKH